MAIQIENGEEHPQIVYDRIFMESLQISQRPIVANEAHPFYILTVSIRKYGVDADGQRHYRAKSDAIRIEDYQSVAMNKAAAGDMDLANAAGAIEQALATIISDQMPHLGIITVED